MTKSELLKRYLVFMLGLFFSSLGISLVTKAGLGTSPISSLPYVLSLAFPLTLGQFTFIVNLALLGAQIVILKRDFQKIQFLQIPMLIVFGSFIDLTMAGLSFLNPTSYGIKIVVLLLGCISLGLGVCIQVLANVVMLSGEALVKAITLKWQKDFGAVKTLFDLSLVASAILMSLIFFSRIEGLREGTVIAAITVGLISRLFIHFFNSGMVYKESKRGPFLLQNNAIAK